MCLFAPIIDLFERRSSREWKYKDDAFQVEEGLNFHSPTFNPHIISPILDTIVGRNQYYYEV